MVFVSAEFSSSVSLLAANADAKLLEVETATAPALSNFSRVPLSASSMASALSSVELGGGGGRLASRLSTPLRSSSAATEACSVLTSLAEISLILLAAAGSAQRRFGFGRNQHNISAILTRNQRSQRGQHEMEEALVSSRAIRINCEWPAHSDRMRPRGARATRATAWVSTGPLRVG